MMPIEENRQAEVREKLWNQPEFATFDLGGANDLIDEIPSPIEQVHPVKLDEIRDFAEAYRKVEIELVIVVGGGVGNEQYNLVVRSC